MAALLRSSSPSRSKPDEYQLMDKQGSVYHDDSDSDVEEFNISQQPGGSRRRRRRCWNNPKYRCIAISLSIVIIVVGIIAIKHIFTQKTIKDSLPCEDTCTCTPLVPNEPEFPQYGVSCKNRNLIAVPEGLPNVTTDLNLENNDLSELRLLPFKGLPNIRMIYLRDNKFTSVDEETLKVFRKYKLHALDLSRNPWDCSCNDENKRFIKWLVSVRGPTKIKEEKYWVALVDGYKTQCVTPAAMKGRRLDQLDVNAICAAER